MPLSADRPALAESVEVDADNERASSSEARVEQATALRSVSAPAPAAPRSEPSEPATDSEEN